ncbi:hypothetical protein Taro_034807 [Colocasia esculenta]|uniref:B box-type domain-containing protein n=1 Tax=Colocasia esculenta TaxID=4460 RepID=A0A843W4Z1_COLES|nr:hypothetical protein [Colocasia esculenta]
MKVQCDVCERAEATVLCCADEAALCARCDDKVHAANKLAGKHQRVPLLSRSSSHNPNCDICQEKAGYFFCLEDRALLCRQCDVAIHTATPYVSSHQRFLVTGVRVGLQHHLLASCSATNSSAHNGGAGATSSGGHSNNYNGSMTSGSPGASNSSPERKFLPAEAAAPVGLVAEEVDGFSGHWPWDELLATADFGHCYRFGSDPSSSRISKLQQRN